MGSSPTSELLSLLGRPPIDRVAGGAGQTWISLFGEGPSEIKNLLEFAAEYIDRAKLAYGSSLLASWETLTRINALLREADIVTYPGGTLIEMALRAGKYPECLAWAEKAGFNGIEICDGVIEMSDAMRADAIRRAANAGFSVTTVVQEVVRKPVIEVVPLADRIRRAEQDLAAGARYVHVVFQAMARGETPRDVVGPIKREQALRLVDRIGADKLVWEALSPDDQLTFIRMLGREVNLGHVGPASVVQLAAHRRGFGYETFWSEVWQREHWS